MSPALARILKLAREIEASWPKLSRSEARDLGADPDYQTLKREIAELADSRLAASVQHLHDRITLAHFYACIVPFERAAGRALRDDEFLVLEGDRDAKLSTLPLKIVAENLRSSFNVGAVFRTAECLGASEILLCGYTPGPDDEKTSRTAMGTSEMIPWRRVDRARTACEELREQGYRLVALETATNAVSLEEIKFGGPTAFVIGNERFGVEAETLALVDEICRIPVRGRKNSLNVGIALGIAAYEFARQRR